MFVGFFTLSTKFCYNNFYSWSCLGCSFCVWNTKFLSYYVHRNVLISSENDSDSTWWSKNLKNSLQPIGDGYFWSTVELIQTPRPTLWRDQTVLLKKLVFYQMQTSSGVCLFSKRVFRDIEVKFIRSHFYRSYKAPSFLYQFMQRIPVHNFDF